jgi:hypothetical protein
MARIIEMNFNGKEPQVSDLLESFWVSLHNILLQFRFI